MSLYFSGNKIFPVYQIYYHEMFYKLEEWEFFLLSKHLLPFPVVNLTSMCFLFRTVTHTSVHYGNLNKGLHEYAILKRIY